MASGKGGLNPHVVPALTAKEMRNLLALISIALAFSVHIVSDGTPETPISFELAQQNPVAIALIISIVLLILQLMYDFWVAEAPFISITLAPVLIALPVIAFTSPESAVHLKVFFSAAAYGVFWIAAIAFGRRKYLLGFVSICLGIWSILFLLGFGLMSIAGQAPRETPVGLFQKALVVLFAILCLDTDTRAQKREASLR